MITAKCSFAEAYKQLRPMFDDLRQKYKRLGIIHLGGPAPGDDLVVKTVINALLKIGWNPVGIILGLNHLIAQQTLIPGEHYLEFGPQPQDLFREEVSIIKTGRERPVEKNFLSKQVFDPLQHTRLHRIISHLHTLRLGGLITLGGDGTLSLAYCFSKLGVPVIHIPKSIDNDYALDRRHPEWFHTYGFETSVSIIRDNLIRMKLDAASEDTYIIVEVMGRRSGVLAYTSAVVAGCKMVFAAEDVLPKETLEQFCERIVDQLINYENQGENQGVIVLSENLGLRFRTELGEGTCDSLGNLQLYSLVTNQKFAEKIADIYRRKTIRASVVKFRTEAIRFDSRQELTAKMAPLDIMLCQVLGRGAVQSALLNQFGSMVYASSTELIPQVCSLQDLVDPMTGAVRKRMVEADSGLGLLVEFLRGPGVYII